MSRPKTMAVTVEGELPPGCHRQGDHARHFETHRRRWRGRVCDRVSRRGRPIPLPEERGPFAAAVAAKASAFEDPPTLDYVRLNMLAVRGEGAR